MTEPDAKSRRRCRRPEARRTLTARRRASGRCPRTCSLRCESTRPTRTWRPARGAERSRLPGCPRRQRCRARRCPPPRSTPLPALPRLPVPPPPAPSRSTMPPPAFTPTSTPPRGPFVPLTLPPPPPNEQVPELWSNVSAPLELPPPGPWLQPELAEDVVFEPERRFVLVRSIPRRPALRGARRRGGDRDPVRVT